MNRDAAVGIATGAVLAAVLAATSVYTQGIAAPRAIKEAESYFVPADQAEIGMNAGGSGQGRAGGARGANANADDADAPAGRGGRGGAAGGNGVGCSHTITCYGGGGNSSSKGVIRYKPNLAYTPTYPFKDVPAAGTGMPSVGIDSQGNVWGMQRNTSGPQLFKFGPGPDHKLLLTVPEDLTTRIVKAHGLKVDKQDNVWIVDETSATIRKFSPDGKLLTVLGERGKRGDWDEAKGQRLLWEPVMLDFGPNGDMYIFEGHANESPNDVGGPDPWNTKGAARVIRLDKDLKFIQQWYGNEGGPGKFDSTHGSAVDPQTGHVWIGDREQYRIIEYTGDGKFVRTLSTKNLICALYFDAFGGLWQGTGHDGQILKLDKATGTVIGAMGNGRGRGDGQWSESTYLVMDAQKNIYSADTSGNRITKWVAPK